MTTEFNLSGLTCQTNGKGLWSTDQRSVSLKFMEIAYTDEHREFGELQVTFDRRTWNTGKHGLIYTDPKFLQDFRILLQNLGFTAREAHDVDYSEQGMQGEDYVSFDVSGVFLRGCRRL